MWSIKDLISDLGKKFNNQNKSVSEKSVRVSVKDFPELINTYNNILKALNERNEQKWKILGAWFQDLINLTKDEKFNPKKQEFKKKVANFINQLTDSKFKNVMSDIFIKKIKNGVNSILKKKCSHINSKIEELFKEIKTEMFQEEKENHESNLLVLQNWFMARLPHQYEKDYEDFVKRKKEQKQQELAHDFEKIINEFGPKALEREWIKIKTKIEKEVEQEKQIKLQQEKEKNEAKLKKIEQEKTQNTKNRNALLTNLNKLRDLKLEMETLLSQLLFSKFDDIKEGRLDSNDYLVKQAKKMLEEQQKEVDSLISQQDSNKKLAIEDIINNSEKNTKRETIDSNLEKKEQLLFSTFFKKYFDGHIAPTLKISREQIVLFSKQYDDIFNRFAEFQKLLDKQLHSSNIEQLKESLKKHRYLSNIENFVEGFILNFEKINRFFKKFHNEEINIQQNIKTQKQVLQQKWNEDRQKVTEKIQEQKALIKKYAKEIFDIQQLEFLQNSFLEKDEDIKNLQQEFQKIPNPSQEQKLKFQANIGNINKQKNNLIEKIRELKIYQYNIKTIFAEYPELEIFNNEIRNFETLKNNQAILFTSKVKAYYEVKEKNKIQLEHDKQELEKLKSEVGPEFKRFRKKFNNLAEIKKIKKEYKMNLMKIKTSRDISSEEKIKGLAELKKYYEKQLNTEWEKWISDITKHPERIPTLLKINRIKLKEKSLEDNKKIWEEQEADLWSEIESIKKSRDKIAQDLEFKKTTFINQQQAKLVIQERKELEEIDKLKNQQEKEWENQSQERKIDFFNKFIDYFPDQKSQLIQLKTLINPHYLFNEIADLIFHNQEIVNKNIDRKRTEENQEEYNLVLAAAQKCFGKVLSNQEPVREKNIFLTSILEELKTLFSEYRKIIADHQEQINELEAKYKALVDAKEKEITNKDTKEIDCLIKQNETSQKEWINNEVTNFNEQFSKVVDGNSDGSQNHISDEVLTEVIKIYFERKKQIEQEIAEQSLIYTLTNKDQEIVNEDVSIWKRIFDSNYDDLEYNLERNKPQKLEEKIKEALKEHDEKRKQSQELLKQGLERIEERKITESEEVEKPFKKGLMLCPSLFQEFLQTFNSLKLEVSQSQEQLTETESQQEAGQEDNNSVQSSLLKTDHSSASTDNHFIES